MAFDLNFGYQPNQSSLFDDSYTPMQSTALTGSFGGTGVPGASDSTGMFSAFNDWLGGDTGRSLFGGTDPSTGFQSMGIVSPTLQGLGSLFQAWNGMRNYDLAKQQLAFQQNAFNTNLTNQRQAYNTALEDRIRGRTSDYSGKEQDVQSYLDQNKL